MTSKKYIIVTGGGSGIGRSLAILLSKLNHNIIIIGRRIDALKETQSFNPTKIDIIQADISDQQSRLDILNTIPKNAKISHLIHNAATIEACELKDITLESWRYQMSVNLEAPLFLTQLLLPIFENDGRILHISSKLAHDACHGVGAHCVSKAALHMLYNCLKLELAQSNLHIGSLRPGAVDTPTQEKVRSFSSEIFPLSSTFKGLKSDNKLQDPNNVAEFIKWVLLDTSNEKFSEAEWNIYDNWHHEFWLTQPSPKDAVNLKK